MVLVSMVNIGPMRLLVGFYDGPEHSCAEALYYFMIKNDQVAPNVRD